MVGMAADYHSSACYNCSCKDCKEITDKKT